MSEKDKKTGQNLQEKLEECEKQKAEYLAGWQRARADLLNYKKDESERIEALFNYGKEGFILKILPVLDNLDIAEKNVPEDLKRDKNVEGLLQILTQLRDFLKNQGVEEIKTTGAKFDPNLHEVIEELEKDDAEHGTILEELQKGYILENRVLRPAKIKIAK